MKKITLMLFTMFCVTFSYAQHTFDPIAGPTNVAAGTPVTINLNDMGNTAAVPAGSYGLVTVTADWEAGGGGPWSSEAELQVTTVAGVVIDIDPPSAGAASSGTATTLTFSGNLSTDYDPSVDGLFEIVLGQSYGGSDANWSNISVTIDAAIPPPANDDFANAEAITCGNTYTGSTAFATLDEDDAPDGVNADSDTQNVWYSYTGSGSPEQVTLSTCAVTDYDSEALIYTGSSGALTFVAEGYDECGAPGYQFETSFISDGTTTYYISLAGYNGANGNYEMVVTCAPPPPANDDCAGAEPLTIGAATTVDNTGATDSGVTASCDSGIISDIWYSFVATATTEAYIDTNAPQVSVWDACGGAELACNAAGAITGLTEGTTYYVRINDDGTARVPGPFTITVGDAPLSADIFAFEGFKYFPNPVEGTLSLRAQDNIQAVAVYNMLGQEVMRSMPNALSSELNMSKLQTGAYFVKVKINDVEENFKVIKE